MSGYNPIETYLQEAEDLLADIEQSALLLNEGEQPVEAINQLFRAFHTIKGSGSMWGFDRVAAFTHHVETVLDKVREGTLPVSERLTELVLAARDHIRMLLGAERGGPPVPPGSSEALVAALNDLSTGPGAEAPQREERTWKIRFRPSRSLLTYGGNPVLLFKDLRSLGPCEVSAHTEEVPPLAEIQADHCYLWWTATLRTTADENAIRDVFIFVVDDGSELEIEAGSAESRPPDAAQLPARPLPPAPAAATVAEESPEPRKPSTDGSRKALVKESTVRVPSARLDRLVNLVGEMVMNQSRLAQAAALVGAPELANPVQELDRLVAALRDDVLGIRMLPIGTIFGRFRRLVHDLSVELGKEVDLITEGAETELDKSILDQLGEPLVHLLRNSIDHGIEPADKRVASGKPRRGTIRLSAVHTGADVVISIDDDGRGVSRAAVRAKAVEKQLIAQDANLNDKEILNLILQPGFSTASKVTNVSGRGVGMDVVKRQIDSLRGSLAVTSDEGKGTRIALRLPLTLAIIDGLLVQVGRDQYIIPMSAITENVELHRAERASKNGRNLVAVRGELIPYIDLREAFGIGGDRPPIEKIVIVRHEETRVGLVVDRVLGTHETVIQSLGKFYRKIKVVSGATIMGDGRVALILDISAVVRCVDGEFSAAPSGAREPAAIAG